MLKHFLFILVALTLLVSGLPVSASAKAACPLAGMMNASNEQMASMPDCHKMMQDKKSGCCDDNTCGTQCSVSGNVSMMPASSQMVLSGIAFKTPRFHTIEAPLAFQLLNTQDRPPKSLA